MAFVAKRNLQCTLLSCAQLLWMGTKQFLRINFPSKVIVICSRSLAGWKGTKKMPEQQRPVGEMVVLYRSDTAKLRTPFFLADARKPFAKPAGPGK